MPEEIDDFEELDDEPDFEEASGNTSPNNNEKNGDDTIPSSRKEDNKNETVDTSSETTSNTDNVVDFPGNPNAENQNVTGQNPDNGYQKASSGREAYQRQINDKNYYNKQQQDAEQRKSEAADKLDKNEKKQDESQKRLEEVQRKKQQRKDSSSDNRTKDEKKEDKKEEKEAKSENKELKKEQKELQSQKNKADLDLKSIAKDKKKAAAFAALHPVQAAQMKLELALKKGLKKVIMWIISTFGPLILGILLLVFIIYLSIGPLMDAWQAFDGGVRGVANGIEKLTNFYRGYGFEDSKTAFFKELEELDEYYNHELDMSLLLSTIFYPETMGYDTSYQDHQEVIDSDPITETLKGGPKGFISYMAKWSKDVISEAGNTYDDETGLTYNAGKIYRLRRLALAMCEVDTSGEGTTVSLSTFLDRMGVMKEFKELILNTFTGWLKAIGETVISLVETIVYTFTGQFDKIADTWDDWLNTLSNIVGDQKATIVTLLSIVSFGLCRVKEVKYTISGGIKVTYYPVKFSQNKYDEYVKNYYFEDTPEIKDLIPGTEPAKTNKKDEILGQIYTNKKLFEELFIEEEGSTEAYQNNCVGSISNSVINGLRLPVDAPEGKEISFESPYAFGVRNGVNHNGVDINGTTVGVGEGDPVYAVADGVVTNSLPNVTCNSQQDSSCKTTQGAWVKIKHTILEGNTEYTFYSVYMHLQTNSGQPDVDSIVKQGDVIGHIGNTGDSSGPHLHFEIRDKDNTALDPTNLFIACDVVGNGDFAAHTTTLTKDAFVSKWRTYCQSNSCNSTFIDNAELIYDTSKEYNINPEFVVTRAMSEGYSPGRGYNYWGIGCTNNGGGADCKTYSSLSDGIKGLASLSIVQNATTVSDIMQSYAYIGDYWYNPGSWSRGGCIYFSYINKYLSASRSSTINNSCSASSCSGSGCLKTTDEDQKAYATWQVDDKMGKNRTAIWGLGN